jgi:hypothetical protein
LCSHPPPGACARSPPARAPAPSWCPLAATPAVRVNTRKQHHRLDESETNSHVTGSRYRADQRASFKATRNPTLTNNNTDWTNPKQRYTSLVHDGGLTNAHPSTRLATPPYHRRVVRVHAIRLLPLQTPRQLPHVVRRFLPRALQRADASVPTRSGTS